MPVITISREIGSEGDAIAELTARRLGYQLVDKNTIEKVFSQYGFIDFKETYDETGFWAKFDPHRAEMVSLLNLAIKAIAYHGNVVLVGRGGFALLKEYIDVLNVRIQAPFSLRVKRMMEKQDFDSQDKAEEFVRESDHLQRDYVESIYGKQWDSGSAFDLIIDSGKISKEMAVDWLVAVTLNMNHLQPAEAPTILSMEIDAVMLDAISKILDKPVD
jgi:cytidylate kinase